jgi:hypothetical protein
MPPIELEYSEAVVSDSVSTLDPSALEGLSVGLNDVDYQFLDLDGEGVSGILAHQAGSYYYKSNLWKWQVQQSHCLAKDANAAHDKGSSSTTMDGSARRWLYGYGSSRWSNSRFLQAGSFDRKGRVGAISAISLSPKPSME